jgi:hypothetical protein
MVMISHTVAHVTYHTTKATTAIAEEHPPQQEINNTITTKERSVG